MNTFHSLGVFCGANPGVRPEYERAAESLGALIGRRGFRLVYGGGSVGLMGAVARATVAHGGEVLGILPRALTPKELAGESVGELVLVETMHERKTLLAEASDAFIALPGGFGTLDELFEMITYGQLGVHHKPLGLLNVLGYYDPLLATIEHMLNEGFVRPQHRALFTVADEPASLLDALASQDLPDGLTQWVSEEEL